MPLPFSVGLQYFIFNGFGLLCTQAKPLLPLTKNGLTCGADSTIANFALYLFAIALFIVDLYASNHNVVALLPIEDRGFHSRRGNFYLRLHIFVQILRGDIVLPIGRSAARFEPFYKVASVYGKTFSLFL